MVLVAGHGEASPSRGALVTPAPRAPKVPRAVRRGARVGLSNGSGYFYCRTWMEAKVAVGLWNYWLRKVARKSPSSRRRGSR